MLPKNAVSWGSTLNAPDTLCHVILGGSEHLKIINNDWLDSNSAQGLFGNKKR
jgi:hypothetical protein